jgi:hypothetical protein
MTDERQLQLDLFVFVYRRASELNMRVSAGVGVLRPQRSCSVFVGELVTEHG